MIFDFDEDIILEAMKMDRSAFVYASDKLKDDKNIVLELMKFTRSIILQTYSIHILTLIK